MERFFRYLIRASLSDNLKYLFFEYLQPIGYLLRKQNDERKSAGLSN